MGAEQLIWLHSDIIVSHSLYPDFGCSLSTISNRDYPNRNYITEPIDAIDLDSYETSLRGRNNDCTVDAVLGICNERQGKPCNKRHLLVELRMDYTNVNNLSATHIKQKDEHSRYLLSSCDDCVPIDLSLCLMFDQSILSQAERWLSRMQSEHSYTNSWLVFSSSTFCNYINAGKQLPYTPRHTTIMACNRFKTIGNTQNIETLDKETQNILRYLSDCRQRYEKGECSYICQCISDSLSQLKLWKFDDEDDIIVYEIIIEDIERHLQSVYNWLEH